MGTEVFANGSEIACQSGDGQVIAAFPDVCISPPPPPAGPVPLPYPDTSASKDMQSGSSTVQIQGGPVMLKDQSFYQSSPLGDEAATNSFGGGLMSGVITGKTYFAAWSMDVKFEGENVDRHLDLTTSNHSGAQPGNEAVPIPNMSSQSTVEMPAVKELSGKVIEFTWDSNIQMAYGNSPVAEPHWREGMPVEDQGNEKIDGTKGGTLNGSKRPGVYLVRGKGGSPTATVKVNITENWNVSGDATLRGVLGGLVMEGSCPTAAGEHLVTVTIQQLPESIQWYKGDTGWGLDVPDIGSSVALANQPRLEVFVILDEPAPFYEGRVWTEALRFLCGKVGLVGLKAKEPVTSYITQYCHGFRHALTYDTYHGAAQYGCDMHGGGSFELFNYIRATSKIVNCYDQAGAVKSLCGAVGVRPDWFSMDPFGFINPTVLVGNIFTNNPFFDDPNWSNKKLTDIDDFKRSSFGRHAFCGLDDKIFDACAGPHLGAENKQEYCQASIDTVTSLYKFYKAYRAGRASDMVTGDITSLTY
jgi:hypothetical protein